MIITRLMTDIFLSSRKRPQGIRLQIIMALPWNGSILYSTTEDIIRSEAILIRDRAWHPVREPAPGADVTMTSALRHSNDTGPPSMRDFMRHNLVVTAVLCVGYAAVFIVGLLGNSCVVAVVFRCPRMRSAANYFIANLALADILVVVFCLPATLLSNVCFRKYMLSLPKVFVDLYLNVFKRYVYLKFIIIKRTQTLQ